MYAESAARTLHEPLAALRRPVAPEAARDGARWRESLALVEQGIAFTRRIVHAGESVYASGAPFSQLHVVNTGMFKTVNCAADGRGQVVGLHFRGDWLGFDGIATGRQACDAVAVDTGEVWTVRYGELLAACAENTALMQAMHAAMSAQIARDCDALLAMGTLPADARVANFLRNWALSLEVRGQRTDQITLHLSRAEIGNFLGMTLETVSRVLARLVKRGVIHLDTRDRRAIGIPNVDALEAVVFEAGGSLDERRLH